MESMHMDQPLRVYCKNCGAPAGFDIKKQTYRCTMCGEITGIPEMKREKASWKMMKRQQNREEFFGKGAENYSCPSCGAQVIFPDGEASRTCDFCGSSLVKQELSDPGQFPDVIIPFYITYEEARKRMLDWGHAHKNTPEGRSVVSNMGDFKVYYLPYRIVRGPVRGNVTREESKRQYHCAGYLEGTAVNTSQQLDNLVLNEMEPFDWSAAKPFQYGYIAGHSVKLCDLNTEQVEKRVLAEAAEDFRPDVERVMQTGSVEIRLQAEDLMEMSALLPVYFIKSGKLTAVMNGQTGRIAVSRERKKTSNPWVLETLLYTILATLLMGVLFGFAPELLALSGFVFGTVFLTILGEGRHSLIRRITLRTEASRARREEGELKIEEGKDILKNPYDNTPVFYERDSEGKEVPVKIRFYTFRRWRSILLRIFLVVFLPAVLAALFRLADMGPDEAFFAGYRPLYGAAWYLMTGLLALMYLVKGVRRDVYEHPLIYEIRPNGKLHLMGKRADHKISILGMFDIGKTEHDGKKLTWFRLIRSLGGIGYFLFVVMIVILIGSAAAILA